MKMPSVPFRLFSSVLLLALLAGCNSESGGIPTGVPTVEDDPVLTGAFIGGGTVAGLHYATATRSGTTNADGEFQYLGGEAVTFSIGGTELGSAPGADVISPFDLFGMKPPSTERAIRRELNNLKTTNFDRVANMALLLQTLDADSDPDNGIDLEDWDTSLMSATISLDSDQIEFAYNEMRDFSLAQGIGYGNDDLFGQGDRYPYFEDRNRYSYFSDRRDTLDPATQRYDQSFIEKPLITPLVHLYKSLQVTVPVLLVESQNSKVEFNNEPNDNYDFKYSYQYDAKGRIVSIIYSETTVGDDRSVGNTSYTYDDDNNLLTEHYQETINNELTINRNIRTFTYDTHGKPVSMIKNEDYFDENDGHLTSSISYIYTYTYDPTTGKLLSAVYDYDETPGDDKPEESYPITYTYGTDGSLLTATYEYHYDLDDTTRDRITSYNNYTYAANYFSVVEESFDYDNSGPRADFINKFTYTYDAKGNLLSKVKDRDNDADGTVDSIAYLKYTYNANGAILSIVEEEDDDANNNVNSIVKTEFSYAANGKPAKVKFIERDDIDVNDNLVNMISDFTSTYNADGNLLSEVTETDSNGDTDGLYNPTNIDSITYTYNQNNGRLLSKLTQNGSSDGVHYDYEESSTYDYIEISDGLLGLLREHYRVRSSDR